MKQKYSRLTIKNNFLFTKVMSDPVLMRQLLQRVLPERSIGDLQVNIEEKTVEGHPERRGIRLDVYCKDETTEYDIEMQGLKKGLPPERARYYQSTLDSDSLNKREDFKKLKDQILIFFCLYDPHGGNVMVYRFYNYCPEVKKSLDDRTIKYYINCTADDVGEYKELKPFVDYINGIMSEDPFVLQVDAAVQKAKRNSKWRKEFMTMQEEIQYHSSIALEQGREEGRILERERTVGLLMKDGKTFAEACRFLCLSADEIQELQEEMTKPA